MYFSFRSLYIKHEVLKKEIETFQFWFNQIKQTVLISLILVHLLFFHVQFVIQHTKLIKHNFKIINFYINSFKFNHA